MNVKIDGRDILLDYRSVIAVEGDHDTQKIVFSFDKLTHDPEILGLNPLVLYNNDLGTFVDPVIKEDVGESILVTWKVDRHVTSTPGELSFMVLFASSEDYKDYLNAEKLWSTKKVKCMIPETLLVDNNPFPNPPLITKLIAIATGIEGLVDEARGVIESFTGEDVVFVDGETFQQKLDTGKLKGDPGPGLNILGELQTVEALPTVGSLGDAYLIGGYLYVWSSSQGLWLNVGMIKGDHGDKGDPGIKGEQGDPGQKGDPGEKGDPGTGVAEMEGVLLSKQDKEAPTLPTTSKTIEGAIAELHTAYQSDMMDFFNIMNGEGNL